jgi:hypothetical protein
MSFLMLLLHNAIIVSREVSVTIDGICIDDRIYWTIDAARDYILQFMLHKH